MRCETCMFFHKVIASIGECRKNVPKIIQEINDSIGIWPEVEDDKWCGEFVFNSGKLFIGDDAFKATE